jgi:hypothetical protein
MLAKKKANQISKQWESIKTPDAFKQIMSVLKVLI